MRIVSGIIFLLFASQLGITQKLSFTHYNIKEGLGGSVVYCMAQDKEGFLWFGTETGLSRFDGTNFKNFFTQDGLPDNEILEIFSDSKGRLWFAPFNKSIAYYYKGKIHNQTNDTLLKKIKITNFITSFAEDEKGNLAIMTQQQLYVINSSGQIKEWKSQNSNGVFDYASISKRTAGGFWVLKIDGLYVLNDSILAFEQKVDYSLIHYAYAKLNEKYLVYRTPSLNTRFKELVSKRDLNIGFQYGLLKINIIDTNFLFFNTRNGVYYYDLLDLTKSRRYLPYESVSTVFRDSENDLWFCTLGNGLYKLNSEEILTLEMDEANGRKSAVMSITTVGDEIYCGTDLNNVIKYRVVDNKLVNKVRYNTIDKELSSIRQIHIQKNKDIVYASGGMLLKMDKNGYFKDSILGLSVKKVHSIDQSHLVVASSAGVYIVDPDNMNKRDTIWTDRATTIFVKENSYLVGSLTGLLEIDKNKNVIRLGDKFQILNNRVSDIGQDSNGVIWVATYGNGVVGIKDDKPFIHLTVKDGLSSNLCKVLVCRGNQVWVGTDKGVNKIDAFSKDYKVTKYFAADGLVSDNINAIAFKDSVIYVGTPAGLTYFTEKNISNFSDCLMRWTGVTINGNSVETDSNDIILPAGNNSIKFDYVGISFRSNGDVLYKYRLVGLDTAWQETRSTFVSYPSLPSGSYNFQIQAINKYGINSEILNYQFLINQYYYEKSWFRLFVALSVFVIMLLGFLFLLKRFKKREIEKTQINSKISALEQLALKSQMNPHFIFNSLNSIQQYVMDKDVAGANKFISGFSRLIRQTLDFSSKQKIGMQEELDYLTNYLELEKTRLEGAFDYSIDVDPLIANAGYTIPPMILQPFVENSVRHGVRYRKDNKGYIQIRVTSDADHIYFVLEDNGVGRTQSKNLKSSMPIEYQSKGMTLTANRVELLNNSSKQKMQVTVEDAFPEDDIYPGTRVIVTIPTHFF